MNEQVAKGFLRGQVHVPPSKSDAQRAVLSAALAEGTSVLTNIGTSADTQRMLSNMVKLGATVQMKGEQLVITGFSSFPGEAELNCGESGLGLRLMATVCAAKGGRFILTGEGSALQRSQRFFEAHFRQWGIAAELNDHMLPLRINGRLRGGELQADGSQSSQYISGLLMALPLLKEDSVLQVSALSSEPYVDMTLATLKTFGIWVRREHSTFYIPGNQHYRATEYTVEGDWSAAGYWLTAAALGHDIRIGGLNPSSLQADRAMLEALEKAGCRIHWEEEVLEVRPGELTAFQFDAHHCPDLFPALVTLAACCPGTTEITGADRLVNKESNRAVALQQEFAKAGVHITVEGDTMRIAGGGRLQRATVDSHNDHRIAMCLAILAKQIDGGLTIERAETVAKSYPDFWKDLRALEQDAH